MCVLLQAGSTHGKQYAPAAQVDSTHPALCSAASRCTLYGTSMAVQRTQGDALAALPDRTHATASTTHVASSACSVSQWHMHAAHTRSGSHCCIGTTWLAHTQYLHACSTLQHMQGQAAMNKYGLHTLSAHCLHAGSTLQQSRQGTCSHEQPWHEDTHSSHKAICLDQETLTAGHTSHAWHGRLCSVHTHT